MENTIVLNSGEKVEILLLDEVSLDIDCSLRYIKSGQKEISDYVNNTAKPQLDNVIIKAQNDMTEQITKGVEKASQEATQAASDTIINSIENAEAQISSYVETSIKPDLTEAVAITSDNAAVAVTSKEMVLSKVAEFEELSNSIKSSIEQTASDVSDDADRAENSALIAEEAAQKAASGNIGDIKYTLRTTEPWGGKWCDGSIYTKDQFPNVYTLLTEGKLRKVSFAEFNTQVETDGFCGCFGLDPENLQFKVPLLNDVYLKAGTTNLDEFATESLSNIATGTSLYTSNELSENNTINYRAYIILFSGQDISSDFSTEIQLNNPFSLLDYKWSEYEITNASWLISSGGFHSGSTYPAVYQLLQQIKSGAVEKAGVNVKLSTETYTDYDFVLNTTDETFRLPVKVYAASGNRVVGNGISVGFTDGVHNNGLLFYRGSTYRYFSATEEAYGANMGSSSVGTTDSLASSAIGLTNDPTKSGMETSSQGLKLYFYVGETVQDAKVINAAGVLARIAQLSNKYIIDLGMPDYTAGISKSFNTQYTAEIDGYLGVIVYSYVSGSCSVQINEKLVSVVAWQPNNYGNGGSIMLPISKGDKFYISNSLSGGTKQHECTFYPLKGAN